MRTPAKTMYAYSQKIGLLGVLQHLPLDREQALYVLAYHRVDELQSRPQLDPSLLSSTPRLFRQEMSMVAHAYHPVSADQVLEAIQGGRPLPRDPVLVTVDDGYCDFAENIFPITHEFGIRPVLFVPTGYVGQGAFWWDRIYAAVRSTQRSQLDTPLGFLPVRTPGEKRRTLETLRSHIKAIPSDQVEQVVAWVEANTRRGLREEPATTLNWSELRNLSRAGVTIAAHTHTHPILTQVSLETARREIERSQSLIQREIGQALPIFAYPDGKPYAINPDLIQILAAAGFKIAFTMIEGLARLDEHNRLCLPRLGMSARMTPAQFHWHLTPAYGHWKMQRAGL